MAARNPKHRSHRWRRGPEQRSLKASLALWFRRLDTTQRLAVLMAPVAILGLAGALTALAVNGSSRGPRAASTTSKKPPRAVVSTTDPVKHTLRHRPICPLTGQPTTLAKIPQRPALGVKIGNDPASRPQTGLLHADIVYDAMAEGGITRYLAIFQCQQAGAIGPIRSVRWNDWHLLASYGHPILAFSGGIDQWDAVVASESYLFDATASIYPTAAAYYRTANRVPPWNLYTSTRALWALDPNHSPPPRQFSYSAKLPPGATKASSVTIANFGTAGSGAANLTWTWSPSAGVWLRSYDGVPDVDSSGTQLRAHDVIIEYVRTVQGPYAESGTVPDTESITEGSGTAYILRNGHIEKGTWHCAAYGHLTQYRMANGHVMTLTPGNTWVELVPEGGSYPVSVRR
ncbi:MAG: DUF3048 domain-containing protein [Acidimicrobiales bacterium]